MAKVICLTTKNARKYAEWALMERLTTAKKDAERGKGDKLRVLQQRIARIRSGEGDTLPEVRAAFLAIEARAKEA